MEKKMGMGMNMGGFGMAFPLLLYIVLIALPVALIIGKAGYSRWWTILALIPMVNLIALWVFALANWPVSQK